MGAILIKPLVKSPALRPTRLIDNFAGAHVPGSCPFHRDDPSSPQHMASLGHKLRPVVLLVNGIGALFHSSSTQFLAACGYHTDIVFQRR